MPFLVAAMIIPYYIPYIIHRTVNRDLINLKNAIKEDDVDADRLTKYFFSVFRHPTLKYVAILTDRFLYNKIGRLTPEAFYTVFHE